MSSSTHGRRRAEPARRKSGGHRLVHAAPKPVSAGQRAAAVTMAGALIVGMGVSDKALNHDAAGISTAAAHVPISAAKDATLSFPRTEVRSTAAKSAAGSAHTVAGPAKVSNSSSSVKKTEASHRPVNDPAGAQAFAGTALAGYGWGQEQMSCLLPLWNRESDWITTAENPSSLAYGIAQSLPAEKMASTGKDWKTNYRTQISWGLRYIKDRYGSPCGAWSHEVSIGWY